MATTSTPAALAFDDLGTGDAATAVPHRLVLEPGALGGGRGALRRSAAASTVDWRGHGGSAAASGDFGLDELVDDALALR